MQLFQFIKLQETKGFTESQIYIKNLYKKRFMMIIIFFIIILSQATWKQGVTEQDRERNKEDNKGIGSKEIEDN